MIKYLKTLNTGPAWKIELEFSEKQNILVGDSNIGKSFLLNTIWWAMTHKWPLEVNSKLTSGRVALPTDKKQKAEIYSSFFSDSEPIENIHSFEPRIQGWAVDESHIAHPDIVLYAMSDGSFAIYDPIRNHLNKSPYPYVFSPKEVWDGLQNKEGTWLCNGLIRDWADWQKSKGRAFDLLKNIILLLSPCKEEELVPDNLTRISLDDVRDMPTLSTRYNKNVAVVHLSSGIQRIISFAYFIVWCLEEHSKVKKLLGEDIETKMVFLIDDVDLHLHANWQKAILKSLMQVIEMISIDTQLIVTTNSSVITDVSYRTIDLTEVSFVLTA